MPEGLWAGTRDVTSVTLIVGVLTFAAVAMLIWLSVGRDVLRVGYVPITKKPSLDTEGEPRLASSNVRHDGVLHLVMADHVDPGLVLVGLRLDGGSQWISTVRTDEQGFGISRLDAWRASARRVSIFEKPRAHEVVFSPRRGGDRSISDSRNSSDVRHVGPPAWYARPSDGITSSPPPRGKNRA